MSERGGRRLPPRADEQLERLEIERLLPPLDGVTGPARRLSSARTARMVSAVVDAATSGAPDSAAPLLSPFEVTRTVFFEPAPTPSARRITRRGVALAAALVAASGAGSVAAGVWIANHHRPDESAAVPEAERAPARRMRRQGPTAAGVEPAPAPEPVPALPPPSEEAGAEPGPLPADRPAPGRDDVGDGVREEP
ncbi:MAG TPA: hypothetical protein VEL05_11210, partial [Candidatus Acidoferrum sp.]|nr:hypothetical protein [Candidatus Acidoferrum sp.]